MDDIKMLHYDKIDVSEETGVNKTSESKECDICHYLYFLNKGFKYQLFPSNRCPDLLIVSMKFSNIYILNIQNDDYHCIISGISKSETIKLLQNIDLTKKNGTL